ncbi:alpha-D-ribose 1-methylphosphonate 5-triphosphate diphosphatase [soil metagenome]
MTGGHGFGLHNVRAVLPDRVLEGATVVVDADGRIASVTAGRVIPAGAIDGGGAFCLPGLIDTHSDGLEKELRPRPNVTLPADFALRSFEGRLRSSGVTTVFHGVGFDETPSQERTVAQAHAFCDVIAERRRAGDTPVEHRILHRVEARSLEGLPAMASRLADSEEPIAGSVPAPPLVSFEDHTPGQGQFRDVEKFRRSVVTARLPAGVDLDAYITDHIADGEARAPVRRQNIAAVTALARSGRVRLLGHDLEDAVEVAEANEAWGAAVAEFPLTLDAASEAHRRAMPVVMGAPNVLRGGSHSGNVAAAELVARGLCDVLASDYQPSTLLAAVFKLAAEGVTSLPAAVRLVTAGPADLTGLSDRGRLVAGARADLVLVTVDGRWPRVRAAWRATEAAMAGAAV